MGQRQHNVSLQNPLPRWAVASVAAAMFVLAGGTQSLGQTSSGVAGNTSGSSKKSSSKSSSSASQTPAPLAPPLPSSPAGSKTSAGPNRVMHAAGENGKGDGSNDDKVKVDDHLIVDLHVNDEDLANVLQMLSIQAQRNIVTSKNVSAVVTANLYGVTFYEALDAILHVNGYGYIERGNFIYVYTLDELQKIEDSQKARVWKVLRLNYLSSVDAAEFVKPLLSDGGQIKTNGKPAASSGNADAVSTAGEDYANDSTMVVFDFPENLGEIEKIIKEMDTRPAQVLIESTILQTSLNESNAFGVDFSVIGDLDFSNFVNVGGPLRAVDALISGTNSASAGASSGSSGSGATSGSGTAASSGGALPADGRGGAITSNAGQTSGPGTLKMGIVYNDVAAFLKILDEVSDTQILSRPNVLCLNRQPARVLVGRKVGYLSTTSTDTSTTQTVEFLDTGTQLVVRPFVSSDGMVRMDLKPKVSEAEIRNVTNSGGAAVTIPDEISNELTANVMVRDGQTVVLGGLFRESTAESRREVPGIGDVPIIGAAFRGHDDSTQRNEIIFMITPTIVNDTVLLEQGKRGEAEVDRVRTGARDGLLPWSRDKRSQQLLVQATVLARDGKKEQALFKIQQSLRMNPYQPDAIALREMIMNNVPMLPSRSVQDDIVNNEVQKWLGNGGKPVTPAAAPAPVPGSNMESAAAMMNTAAHGKQAPVVNVSVETLEPMETSLNHGGEAEKMWLPATADEPVKTASVPEAKHQEPDMSGEEIAEPKAEASPEASSSKAGGETPASQSTASATSTKVKPAEPVVAKFPAPSLAQAMDSVLSEVTPNTDAKPFAPQSAPAEAPGAEAKPVAAPAQPPVALVPSEPTPAAQTADGEVPATIAAPADGTVSTDAAAPAATPVQTNQVVSSSGFWGFWKLYADYFRRQVSPTSDSAITSAPSDSDNR